MDESSERYFPNHSMQRDIGLAEYSSASERLSSEDRALSWSTNTSILISTIASAASFRLSEFESNVNEVGYSTQEFKGFALATILLFSLVAILHLSNLIKSRAFSERKIIVLRRMLGVSYGDNTLVLPNWRIEGADNPFAIRLFPGFISYRSSPVLIVLFASSVSVLLLSNSINAYFPENLQPYLAPKNLAVTWLILGLFVFRYSLNETNENLRLWIAKLSARICAVPLSRNFEDSLYRARLSVAEAHRINADFHHIRTIALHIEDKQFFQHKGVNWRGVFRAALGIATRKRRGGGSSITQQLARSVFITRLDNTLRRKVVEMFLAKWLNSVLDKSEELDAYLTTARFDSGVYGFHRGFRHFFHEEATRIERWEAFFLVERLGNIRNRCLSARIESLARVLVESGKLSKKDAHDALKFYEGMVSQGNLELVGAPLESVRSRISQLP